MAHYLNNNAARTPGLSAHAEEIELAAVAATALDLHRRNLLLGDDCTESERQAIEAFKHWKTEAELRRAK